MYPLQASCSSVHLQTQASPPMLLTAHTEGKQALEGLILAAAAAKSLQSCPTLCDPIDGSPPGFPVPGILQARTLEWVAISFSNAWKWKVKMKSLSCVQLFMTPWTAAYQAPLSMGFSRQEYWSGVPLPSPTGNWLLSLEVTLLTSAPPTHWSEYYSPTWQYEMQPTLYLGGARNTWQSA